MHTREVTITVQLDAGEAELVRLEVDGHRLDMRRVPIELYRTTEAAADAVLRLIAPQEREDMLIHLGDPTDINGRWEEAA